MKKATAAHTDTTLLILRSTHVDQHLPLLAEMLNMRQMKSNLPMKIPNQRQDKDTIAKHVFERQQLQKLYHNRKGTTGLASLDPGQSACIQHPTSEKWHPATVVNTRQEPRSYDVQQATVQRSGETNTRYGRPGRSLLTLSLHKSRALTRLLPSWSIHLQARLTDSRATTMTVLNELPDQLRNPLQNVESFVELRL